MTKRKRIESADLSLPSREEWEESRKDDSLASWNEDVRELTRLGVPPELWGEYIARWRVDEVENQRRLAAETRLRAEAVAAGVRNPRVPSGDEEA